MNRRTLLKGLAAGTVFTTFRPVLFIESVLAGNTGELKVWSVASGDYIMVGKVIKSDDEWRKQLTQEQFHVTREQGTEPAFSGKYWETTGEQGVYRCICCGQDLFSSKAKYDSGTGWPSYYQPVAPENVGTEKDRSWFMVRTEVHCSRCDAHLGHVFDDGPKPTGLRYCINSASLDFIRAEDLK